MTRRWWHIALVSFQGKQAQKPGRMRNTKGSAISEFGPALAISISVVVPLVYMIILFGQYLAAQGVLNELTERLAHAESRSHAHQMLDTDSTPRDFLKRFGIKIDEPELAIVAISSNDGKEVTVKKGEPLPPEWLPAEDKGTNNYYLELSTTMKIPVVVLKEPVKLEYRQRSVWENLSIDPETQQYYINE